MAQITVIPVQHTGPVVGVRNRIRNGDYDLPTIVRKRSKRVASDLLRLRFKDDAIKAVGLKGHPKAGHAFHKAWEESHAFEDPQDHGRARLIELINELEKLAWLMQP